MEDIENHTEAGLAPGIALLFDMDGVLIHSNPVHREAWSVFSRRFGVEATNEMIERMFGRRNDDIVRDFFGPDLPPEELAARGNAKERLYREMMERDLERHLVPGVRDFLSRRQGSPMGLATNAEPANVDFVLDRAELRHYFQVIVDGSQIHRPKPDPEVFLRAAELLGVAPANCIVFEDSYGGVEAGRAAGMRVVGVTTTYKDLPGTNLAIDNFRSGSLEPWLLSQNPAV